MSELIYDLRLTIDDVREPRRPRRGFARFSPDRRTRRADAAARGHRAFANINPRGFTLIEVLIAIALILAMIGTMYGFLFDVLSSRVRILEHVRQETAASTLIKQLDADLMTCIVGDRTAGSGISGDERRLRVLSRSVSANLATRGPDDPEAFGDLQFAEYRFDAANHRLEGRRGSAATKSDSPFSPLEGEIHKLRFRFFDGRQWRTSFDSLAENRLPKAVEVAMWYRPLPDEIDPQDSGEGSEAGTDEIAAEEIPAAPAETPEPPVEIANEESPTRPDRVRIFIILDAADASAEPTAGEEPGPTGGDE